MPFYEYQCQVCKVKFEDFGGINDEPLQVCPGCGGKVQRLISKSTSAQIGLGPGNAHEYMEKVIKPDAQRIAQRIRNGDEDAAADVFGSGEK